MREVLREDDQPAILVGGRIDHTFHLALERLNAGDGPEELRQRCQTNPFHDFSSSKAAGGDLAFRANETEPMTGSQSRISFAWVEDTESRLACQGDIGTSFVSIRPRTDLAREVLIAESEKRTDKNTDTPSCKNSKKRRN